MVFATRKPPTARATRPKRKAIAAKPFCARLSWAAASATVSTTNGSWSAVSSDCCTCATFPGSTTRSTEVTGAATTCCQVAGEGVLEHGARDDRHRPVGERAEAHVVEQADNAQPRRPGAMVGGETAARRRCPGGGRLAQVALTSTSLRSGPRAAPGHEVGIADVPLVAGIDPTTSMTSKICSSGPGFVLIWSWRSLIAAAAA